MQSIRKAVIPAAGFGTRFLPATKAMPKEMLPIVDKPTIQYVVESLVTAGVTDVIIVTGYTKRLIEDHFDAPNQALIENLKAGGKDHLLGEIEAISDLANFSYVRQKGRYGNLTPIQNVENLIGNEPFIYAWADDFIVAEQPEFVQLCALHEQYPDASILAAIRVNADEDYSRYGFAGGKELAPGVIDVDRIVEKPGKENAPSQLALASGMILQPAIYQYMDRAFAEGTGREVTYIDALDLMRQDGHQVIAAEVKGGKFYDTGNKLAYLKTNVEFALQREDIGGEFRTYLEELISS